MSCVFKGTGNGRCGGGLQAHHAIKRQRIRRAFPYGAWRPAGETRWRRIGRHGVEYELYGEGPNVETISLARILEDDRNLMWVCKDHHDRVTGAALHVAIPESVWEFAAEFGFTAELENDLARRAA